MDPYRFLLILAFLFFLPILPIVFFFFVAFLLPFFSFFLTLAVILVAPRIIALSIQKVTRVLFDLPLLSHAISLARKMVEVEHPSIQFVSISGVTLSPDLPVVSIRGENMIIDLDSSSSSSYWTESETTQEDEGQNGNSTKLDDQNDKSTLSRGVYENRKDSPIGDAILRCSQEIKSSKDGAIKMQLLFGEGQNSNSTSSDEQNIHPESSTPSSSQERDSNKNDAVQMHRASVVKRQLFFGQSKHCHSLDDKRKVIDALVKAVQTRINESKKNNAQKKIVKKLDNKGKIIEEFESDLKIRKANLRREILLKEKQDRVKQFRKK